MTHLLLWLLLFPLVEVAYRVAESRLLSIDYTGEERRVAALASLLLYLTVAAFLITHTLLT